MPDAGAFSPPVRAKLAVSVLLVDINDFLRIEWENLLSGRPRTGRTPIKNKKDSAEFLPSLSII